MATISLIYTIVCDDQAEYDDALALIAASSEPDLEVVESDPNTLTITVSSPPTQTEL